MEQEPHNTNEVEKKGKDTLEEHPHVLSAEEQQELDKEFIVPEEHPPHPEDTVEKQEILRRFEIEAQNEDAKDKPDSVDATVDEVRSATSSPVITGALHKLGYLSNLKSIFALANIKKITESKKKTTAEKTEEVVGEVVNVAVPVIGGPIYQTGLGVIKRIFGDSPEEKAKKIKEEDDAFVKSISPAVPR